GAAAFGMLEEMHDGPCCVVAMNPRHLLLSIPQATAEPQLEGNEHLGESAPFFVEDHPEAQANDSYTQDRRLLCLAFPDFGRFREEVVTRWRLFGELFVSTCAVVADGG